MLTRRTLLALVSLLLVACGLKGPLYSPDEGKEEVAPTAPATQESAKRPVVPIPAPQAQKRDRQKDSATSQAPAGDTTTPTSPPDPDRPATSTPLPPPKQ